MDDAEDEAAPQELPEESAAQKRKRPGRAKRDEEGAPVAAKDIQRQTVAMKLTSIVRWEHRWDNGNTWQKEPAKEEATRERLIHDIRTMAEYADKLTRRARELARVFVAHMVATKHAVPPYSNHLVDKRVMAAAMLCVQKPRLGAH